MGSEKKVQSGNLASVGEVAERLNLSKPRVYELGRSGRIPVIKIGPGKKGAVRFDWVDVEMFIRDHKRRKMA